MARRNTFAAVCAEIFDLYSAFEHIGQGQLTIRGLGFER